MAFLSREEILYLYVKFSLYFKRCEFFALERDIYNVLIPCGNMANYLLLSIDVDIKNEDFHVSVHSADLMMLT